jgi:flavin reductase (DIM6/NTAB) family NADH-FMN oxidoreductase RutF
MTDDQAALAAAVFSRLAVAVAVITTLDDGQPHGSTGMAWAEHGTPPLLLTTLRRGGHTRALVEAAGRFGVSILSERQRAYTRQFATREAAPGARFAGVPFTPGPALGVPLLDGCAAALECEVQDIYPFGGHDIVVARVASASAAEGEQPVVHYNGQLWELRPPAAAPGELPPWEGGPETQV